MEMALCDTPSPPLMPVPPLLTVELVLLPQLSLFLPLVYVLKVSLYAPLTPSSWNFALKLGIYEAQAVVNVT